jgi:hypothetical protein
LPNWVYLQDAEVARKKHFALAVLINGKKARNPVLLLITMKVFTIATTVDGMVRWTMEKRVGQGKVRL